MNTALLIIVLAAGLQAPQTPSRFKNIQALNGMSDREIQQTMQSWGRQLGMNCTGCHVQGDFATDQKEQKKTARKMYQMVEFLNKQEFFGTARRKADCFLCHRGSPQIPAP